MPPDKYPIKFRRAGLFYSSAPRNPDLACALLQRFVQSLNPSATAMSAHSHGFPVGGGTVCIQCNEPILGPDNLYDFSEEKIIVALWSCAGCGYRGRHSVHSGNPNVACGHSEGRELPLIDEACSSHTAEQLGRAHFQWFGCTQQVRLKLSILSKPAGISWLLSGDLTR